MRMYSLRILVLTIMIGTGAAFLKQETTHAQMPRHNALFAYPHLLPSPFTLPARRLSYCTRIAFGLTDFLTIVTNILRDFFKIYNADLKIALIDFPEFAFSLTQKKKIFCVRVLLIYKKVKKINKINNILNFTNF